MATVKIKIRRGLASAIPTLDAGEIAYTTDTKRLYMGEGSANIMFYNAPDVDALLGNKQSTSQKGQANGYASLGADGKVPTAQLPDAIVGAMVYQGVWNATTNNPTIPAAASGNKGHYYKVSVAGSTNIDGITDWKVGDWIVSNGTMWDKIDNTEQVSSVAGKVGAVTLEAADITNFQTAVSANTDVAANTAARHTHSNMSVLNATTASFTTALETKLGTIEEYAEVNNISDTNAGLLTGGNNTTLHWHASDRDRANHTGSQAASTITNFATEVNAAITLVDGGTW